MKMKKRQKKWRRLNQYICLDCGKYRSSLIFNRAKEGICHKCAKGKVPENQPSLFELTPEEIKKAARILETEDGLNIIARVNYKKIGKVTTPNDLKNKKLLEVSIIKKTKPKKYEASTSNGLQRGRLKKKPDNGTKSDHKRPARPKARVARAKDRGTSGKG
jgi:hypothetical protein